MEALQRHNNRRIVYQLYLNVADLYQMELLPWMPICTDGDALE